MNELIIKWKNGNSAIYRFTTKGDAITAKMIFENHCRDEIKDIKINTLDQEQKTGHWINPYGGNWHCDKCDHEQGRKSNFCPNCGARMIESEEV